MMMIKKTTAQKIYDEAQRFYANKDFRSAAQAFTRAASAYDSLGDVLMSAEMKNNLCVALLRARQISAAFEAARGTEKVFAKAGDHKRQGIALANQASALEGMHQPKTAIAYYRQAADAFEQADEGDLRAEVMQLLSMLYFRRGKFIDAVISLQSGIAGAKNPTPRQRFMKKFLFLRLWR